MCVWNPVKSHMVRGFGRLVCCWLWKFGLCFSSNEEFIEFWQKAACEFLKLCRRTASYTLLSSGELHLLTGVQADSRSSCRKVHFGRMRDRRWGRGGAHAPPPSTYTCSSSTLRSLLFIKYDLHHQEKINRYSLCSVNWVGEFSQMHYRNVSIRKCLK